MGKLTLHVQDSNMAVNVITTVNTDHEDMIHDAQMDYYGRRLATCSSDKSVKVYDVVGDNYKLVANLRGHDGPVWQIAWAHPMYGNILASCSYDRKVIIWKETGNEFQNLYESQNHDSSVNSICWAPHEYGLMLACGASDGAVSIISTSGDGNWEVVKIPNAHSCIGCNAVTWAPAIECVQPNETGRAGFHFRKRLVSGGCDNLVKIWMLNETETEKKWVEEDTLDAHSDWVRDVAWAPNCGLPDSILASCSLDCRVIIWRKKEGESTWTHQVLNKFNDSIWHISWSVAGNILAVSGADNKVSLWKESLDGSWICVSDVEKGQNATEREQ